MKYYEVAPNRIVRAGQTTYTYSYQGHLEIGQLVEIEIGSKKHIGIVLKQTQKTEYSLKEIIRVLEDRPLPPAHVHLALWLSDYYATPLAIVLQTMLPRGVGSTRRVRIPVVREVYRKRTNFLLNDNQRKAVQKIASSQPSTSILHGVTGSGKTAVYIELARQTLAAKKSVVVLVPEIALTSQLVDEFSHHFDDIILTHSSQTEAERHLAWREALISSEPRVVIGPRSAIFLPLSTIGLIVIDEAHEPTYKQEQSPRYNALRAARTLADFYAASVVLGSATPLAADYYVATQTHSPIIKMPRPAVPQSTPLDISLIDMTKRAGFKRHRFLSDKLLAQIEQNILEHKQTLIFHNRRGSTSTTLCENCGWQAGCSRCFIPLTLHADAHQLRCHICGITTKVPTSCPVCSHVSIIHKGIGTKLIESELQKLFPKEIIARFDGDATKGLGVESRYKELYDGTISIIVGTQVIAKGLDLPKLRTVGIVQADAGLSLPDYSANERTFQLLAQVIGRVGRAAHASNVIVQSYQPTHPIVVSGLGQDYNTFYERTLKERKKSYFPPYCFLLKLVCSYKTEATAVKNAQSLATLLNERFSDSIEILGPTPAFYERVRDSYRWQLVIKSSKRKNLIEVLKHLPPTHWQYELDPGSLL